MNRRKQQQVFVYVILASVAMILIIIAVAGGGGGTGVPGRNPAQPVTTPSVTGTLNQQQQAAFDRLTQESAKAPTIIVEQGVVRYLTADVSIPDSAANGAEAKADFFLRNYSDLFQWDSTTSEITYIRSKTGESGDNFIRYKQTIQDIPVYGSDVIVSISKTGHVEAVNSGYIPSPTVATTPTLSEADALAIATQDQGAETKILTESKLTIYSPVVFGLPSPEGSHLAWWVVIENQMDGSPWSYLIDAHNGQILERIYELQESRNREVWDAHGRNVLLSQFLFMSTKVMDENGAVQGQDPDEDAKTVWNNAGQVYDYYLSRYGRDSYDNGGAILKNYVHADVSCPNNAGWHPWFKAMFYCDNATGVDVISHELTHGVTSSEANLEYKNESGALNESYSDVFAAMIDQANPWLVTIDDAGNHVIRNLGTPGDGYPRRYQDWVNAGEGLCTKDKEKSTGCVHINSSIPSLAAFFLSEGGEQDGVRVSGIGRAKVERIYYDTLVNRLGENSNFVQARQATVNACESLIGSHGITQADCREVGNAFAAVGIGTATNPPVNTPTDTPEGSIITPVITTTPAPFFSADTSTVLVFDTSGSMDEQDISGSTKIDAAKQAGQRILDILEAEGQASSGIVSQIGLVRFSTYTEVVLALTNDIPTARNALEGLYSQDMTGMADGLQAGISVLENKPAASKPIIILLSDGLPNLGLGSNPDDEYEVIKQQVLDLASQAGGKGICIYTVGFGDPGSTTMFGTPSIDEEFLRSVAQTSGCGEYYNAQNATQLANIYVELRHTSTGNVLLSQSGNIAQGEQLTIASVTVPDNQSQMIYTLNWPGSKLSALLVDPNGQQVTSGYPDSAFFNSNSLASVIIQNPLAGGWQVQAQGLDVPGGTTNFNAVLSVRPSPVTPTPLPLPTLVPTPIPVMPAAPGFPIALLLLILGGGAVAIYVLYTTTRRNRQDAAMGTRPAAGPGAAQLVILSGPNTGQSVTLYDGLTIGRNRSSGLFLADTSVSRQHAVLRYSQGSWFIQDQSSKGGTYINGQRLPAARLTTGDRINIGGTTIEFHG